MSDKKTPAEIRVEQIEAKRKELNITRAHAASIVDAETAQANRTAALARQHAEEAAGQHPSTMEGAQ